MRRLRVVAHNGAHLWGGGEVAVARILRSLAERGHRVQLLCNDPVVARGAAEMGVPARLARLGGDLSVHHALRLAAALRGADAFLLGTFKKLWLGALAARLAGVGRVVARIGLESDRPRNLKYRWLLRRGWIHTVVLNAESMRPAYEGVAGLPAHRVRVIVGGVSAPARSRPAGAVRAELGLAPDAPVIGAVSRLAEQKRLDRLLHALTMLDPATHCVLAGEGPAARELRVLAERLGISARVHLLGFRRDVGDVLDALDLFVVSSDREGMAGAMLEALAAGVPVVSTRVSGAEEALAPLPDGSRPGIVTERDPAALAGAVRLLLEDPALRRRASDAARARAAARFSPEEAARCWEQVLGA